MKRIALIITNPGDEGTENYCQGVNVDNSEYKKFLMSKYGGAWIFTKSNDKNNEIIELYKPTLSQLKSELISIKLARIEYLLVIFCGHGYYSRQNQCTMLEMRTGVDVPETIFHDRVPKTCIILDSCRVFVSIVMESFSRQGVVKLAAEEKLTDLLLYKEYYNKILELCSKGILTLYSCSISQSAQDNEELGGIFSYYLRKSGYDWISQQVLNYVKEFKCLRMREAFNIAKSNMLRSSYNQVPHIEPVNPFIDFPWCIYLVI